jgi:hypothetical protein
MLGYFKRLFQPLTLEESGGDTFKIVDATMKIVYSESDLLYNSIVTRTATS